MSALVLTVAMAVPAAVQAQSSVTSSDIQRLRRCLPASSDLSRLRRTRSELRIFLHSDSMTSRRVIYLKVKLRKEGTVSRADYVTCATASPRSAHSRAVTCKRYDCRSSRHLERGRGDGSGAAGGVREWQPGEHLSAGSQSGTARSHPAGDRCPSSTPLNPLPRRSGSFRSHDRRGPLPRNDVLIPAGPSSASCPTVDRATRTDRKGQLTVSFDQVTIRGLTYPMRAPSPRPSKVKG